MFDLTVLPYFVFAFMAIPPFIFGYFKGWRSGLFTLLLTLITGGILVGISVGIYESALWPLFKGLFINNHNDAGLDVESLKEISKTSVVSVSVGIALLPGVLIMWGLYRGFRKLLNKYMQPKLKKISKNEVGIYRKNLKLTRAGGVVLNGAAGLIIASAAAGAVSTLTVPSNKSNFFNSMTNAIGDGMTFGQGQYNEDYQRMFEFVNDGAYYQNQIDLFRTLFGQQQTNAQVPVPTSGSAHISTSNGKFGIAQADYEAFAIPKAADMKEHDKFITDTNLMAKDSEQISKALVLMLLNASQTQKDFHLVGFDHANDLLSQVKKEDEKNVHLDSSSITESEANIDASIKAFTAFLGTNNFGIRWNHVGVAAAVREYFESRFISYNDSPYKYNVNHQEHALADAKTKLTSMKQRLASDKSNITQYETTQRNNVAKIVASGKQVKTEWDEAIRLIKLIGLDSGTGSDYPSLPTQPDINTVPWNGQWTEYDENTNIPTPHSFYTSIPNIQAIPSSLAGGTYKAKEDKRIQNEKDLQATQDALDAQTVAQQDLETANSQLSTLKTDLANLKGKLVRERSDLATKTAFISRYDSHAHQDALDKRDGEKAKNDSLETIKDDDDRKLGTANSKLLDARSAQITASGDAKTAQQNYDDGVQGTKDRKGDLDKANADLKAAENKVPGLQNIYNTLSKANSDKRDRDPSYITPITESSKISAAQKALHDAENDVIAKQGLVSKAQTKYDEAIALSKAQMGGLNTANKNLRDANSVVTRAQREQGDAQKEYDTALKNFNDSTKRLKQDEADLAQLKNKYDGYETDVRGLNTQIPLDERQQKVYEDQIIQKNLKINGSMGLVQILNDRKGDYITAKGISDSSTAEYKTKKQNFESQARALADAALSIDTGKTNGTTVWTAEQALETQIKNTITDKLVLEDPTTTDINPTDSLKPGAITFSPVHADDDAHWSIKDQEWTVADIENAKAQYVAIDKEKSKLYTDRKEELIEDITKALS